MALDVGELVATLRVTTNTAASDMAKADAQLTSQAAQSGKKAGGAFSGALGGALKSGLVVGAGFAAFEGVEKFISGSVEAASELNETVARTRVVFGTSQQAVTEWAASTDKSLGLSKQAALEYAAQLGNLYEQLGFTQSASAKLSEETTTLAVKIGAFRNVDPTSVITALESGYRGQLRALQKLVPGLTAAQVSTEALTLSGKKNADQLTAQDKATAVLTLVQKDAGNATAFYAESSGELARQQKIANAEFDNAKAALGQAMIPLLTELAKVGGQDVLPFLVSAANGTVTLIKDLGPLASAGKDVLDVFNALPAPLRDTALGLLAVAVVRPKLAALTSETGVLTRAGGSLRTSLDGVRLAAMYAGEEAGGSVSKFGAMRSAIGASAGAGLRGASSGLLDVLGGPWGIAFGVAGAAVGLLIEKHEKAVQEVNNFTQAVEQDSGALGENTKAAIVNQLQQSGALTTYKELGGNINDLTESLLGNAPAQARVNDLLGAYAGIPLATASGQTEQLAIKAGKLSEQMGDTGGALAKGVAQAKDYAAAMGATSGASDGAAGSQTSLGGAVDGTTGSINSQTTAVQTWIQALDTADGNTLSLRSSNRDWIQSIADAQKALHDNGKTLDLNTSKGRNNAAALDSMASAAQAHNDAMKADGKSNTAVTAALEAERSKLYATARQFGLSKTAAHNYVNQVLAIPKSAGTKITTPGLTTAQKNIAAYAKLLSKLPALEATQLAAQQNKNAQKGNRSANGNIFYAAGGENHIAQIAAAGANRIWAEPETGGEAYIPLAAAKRARSTAILSDVANRFGSALVPTGGSSGGGMNVGNLVNVENVQLLSGSPGDIANSLAFKLSAAGH